MKAVTIWIALASLLVTSCVSVTEPHRAPVAQLPIQVDGDFSDWRALGIPPVVVDPENDALAEYSSGDVKAVYYTRIDSSLFFYVSYSGATGDQPYALRLWLDANSDGHHDEHDYQIEVINDQVVVQTLAEPFEGYVDLESEAASLPNSIEFRVSADDLLITDDIRLSGMIAVRGDNALTVVDEFEGHTPSAVEQTVGAQPAATADFVPADLPESERDAVVRLGSQVIKVLPHPSKGFNYDFYLYLPSRMDQASPRHLLVTSIASGGEQGRSAEYYSQWARDVVTNHSWERSIAEGLQAPLVYPAFERPQNSSHASLTRGAMLVRGKRYSRLDLQMIAMIRFAQELLHQELDLRLEREVLMAGYSTSGSFTSRFALMHPEIVRAAAYGGMSNFHILPYSSYGGADLTFPVGIADFQQITGREFNEKAYFEVPLFYFEGGRDTGDVSQYGGLFPRELQGWLYEVMGRDKPTRWDSYTSVLQESGMSIQTRMYPELGHELDVDDVVDFLRLQTE